MARLLNFLVAEDDENDRFFLSRAFLDAKAHGALMFVADGEEAVDYLGGSGKFAERARFPYPDVLVLDLKMPRLDGFEVLRWMRSRSACRCIPVIVLSGSNRQEDVRRAFELGANSYLKKPCNSGQLVELASNIAAYWGQYNELPERLNP